jgi:diguanylate cyclase (GGDEF)-like protein/PAS domain S-box-containing protein
MRRAGADSLVAEHPNGELGIVTERDVVRHIASYDHDARVWDMANAPMTTILTSDSLFYARNLMVSHQFRHLGVIDSHGGLIGIIGFRDILSTIEQSYIEELEIALAERDSALRASEERYRMLVELSPDAILVVQDDHIAFVNPAAQRLLGADRLSDVTDQSFWDFLSPWPNLDPAERRQRVAYAAQTNDHRYIEEAIQRVDGQALEVELLATEITYSNQRALQIVLRDISERKHLERELNILARTDSLTGVANRMHFEPHLEQAAREADRYGYRFSLIMFDIDHFKGVNDTFGHDAADRILTQLAATVRAQLRESDILCRWGGEEFMILAASTDETEAQRLAERIQTAVREADFGIGRTITLTLAAAGYRPNEGLQHLTYRLDSALYAGKGAGRDRTRVG